MSEWLDKMIEAVGSSENADAQKALLAIAEVAAANRISGFRSDFVPEANNEVLAWPALEKLENVIIRFIEEHPDSADVVSAFCALGKFRDKKLEPIFARWLGHFFQTAVQPARVVGQILVSMNDSGIPVLSGRSYSFDDYGKNLADASAYLKKNTNRRK